MKKGAIVAIILVVFIIIGVVVYLFATSGSKTPTTSTTTSHTGLGNLLDHISPSLLGALIGVPTLGNTPKK